MVGRVGRRKVDLRPEPFQPQCNAGRHGRLADAAFPHRENHALARFEKIPHQIVERLFSGKWAIARNARYMVRRKHPPDIGDIGKVIRAQGHAERRKSLERLGHGPHGGLLPFEELSGNGILIVRLLEQAVDDKHLIVDAERLQFVRRAGGFFQRRGIRTAYQYKSRCGRIGKCMYGLLVYLFALFQSRQLAEARRAVRTFADKGTPCRGKLQHPQRVSRRGRVKNNMVVLPLNLRIGDKVGKGIERRDLHRAGAG